ncbi:MAG: glycosyltransferase [Phycisphaeraceae bacterium]|nr:glycosyltransferase [Phycisphaeraceae bacterium]
MSAIATAQPIARNLPLAKSDRAQKVRAIYVDCTHVFQTKNRSGIPRVVRNLAILGSGLSGELGVPVSPIVLTSRGLATIPPEWLSPRDAEGVSRILRRFVTFVFGFFATLSALIAFSPFILQRRWIRFTNWTRDQVKDSIKWIKRSLPQDLLVELRWGFRTLLRKISKHGSRESHFFWFWSGVRWILKLIWRALRFGGRALARVWRGVAAVARFGYRSIRYVGRGIRALRAKLGRGVLTLRLWKQHVDFSPGDVLLLADSNWQVDVLWTHVKQIRTRGALVGSVMYDLIPLRRPDFVGHQLFEVFTRHLFRVTENNDFIIGISRDTSRDFLEFALSTGVPGWNDARAGTFRLGGDKWTKAQAPCSDACREVVRKIGTRPAYLIVGTFEIRKNHKAVLDAFDRLWDSGEDVCLLILGRPGFRADDQMKRVREHREWGKRLFWASNASDSDLEAWYEASRGVIMASYAEGFGLPVAEAMARGKPAFASGIPAHREIAEGFCEFFDPARPEELARLLREDLHEKRNPRLKPVEEFVWPDWPESVRECMNDCIRMASLGPRATSAAPVH